LVIASFKYPLSFSSIATLAAFTIISFSTLIFSFLAMVSSLIAFLVTIFS
jgi:hypothetical protein